MRIPWWHNVVIVSKCSSQEEAFYYVQNTLKHGWSRSVLTHHIELGLWQREGKAITNFNETLPAAQSDLAKQSLKDPYIFDFLVLSKDHNEPELEQGLVNHIRLVEKIHYTFQCYFFKNTSTYLALIMRIF